MSGIMEDVAFKNKYQKCKYRVKQWEKEFKKKHGRVPSKLDIRDSPSVIKNSYKMYYQLKTSLLKHTLFDALDEDDDFDGSLMSQESSFSCDVGDITGGFGDGTILNDSALSERNSSLSGLLTKPIGTASSSTSFEAEKEEKHNLIAWQGEKSHRSAKTLNATPKEEPAEPPKPVGMKVSKLMSASSVMIPKRNPRKSMSRNSFGMSSTGGTTSSGGAGNGTKMVLPDLETLLMAKSKELEMGALKEEEKSREPPSAASVGEPINQLDVRWLNRQSTGLEGHGTSAIDLPVDSDVPPTTASYGLRNINVASIASSTSFGMSSLSVSDKAAKEMPKPGETEQVGVQNTAYDRALQSDSDGVVENSEDEDSKTSPGMMHIAKKRKIFTTINRSPVERVQSQEKVNNPRSDAVANGANDVENLDPQGAKEQEPSDPPNRVQRVGKQASKGKSKPVVKKLKPKSKAIIVPRARSTRANARNVPSYRQANGDVEDDEHVHGFSSDDTDKDPDFVKHDAEDDASSHGDEGSDQEEPKKSPQRKPKRQPRSAAPPKQPKTRRTAKKVATISPKLSPGSSMSGVKQRKAKNVAPRKMSVDDEEPGEEEEPQEYVPEFGLDRLKSIPRIDINELVRDTKMVDEFIVGADVGLKKPTGGKLVAGTSTTGKETILRKKMAAGKLNENFVRVDLRRKVFVKGKKTMNFSRYKKSQWKAKKAAALSGPDMDMGGCDGGVLTCFRCGGTGHMARQCKKPLEDKLLPYAADDVEDCGLPTLEEADAMAKSRTAVVHSNRMDNLPPVANPTWKEAEEQAESADSDGPIDADAVEDEIDAHDDPAPPESSPPKPAYIGHTIPKDFLAKSGLLEVTSASGSKASREPVYALPQGGDLPSTPAEVYDTLHMFGHKSFRHGQEQAVMRILCGLSTLVTLSTGAGKSLCYQLPAYLYRQKRKCITLVISPLVSLMEDQVHGMPDFLNAKCLHTNQTPKVRDDTMEAIAAGEVDVLLISPEAVVSGEKSTGFGSLLRQLPPIAFACIDEAHCVSQWSHNFRPSYLMICKVLKEKLGVKTILGLTATATVQTRQSIVSHLAIPDGLRGIISDIPLPDNLLLTVSRDVNRDAALVELLLSERFSSLQSIIVYCTRRDDCERIATFIRTCFQDAARAAVDANKKKRKLLNYVAEPYHAGLPASRRRTIQKAFMSGELRIVVATIAFGMGINKSDIRAIVHYNMPKNFESYVQEVGRAGRDGLVSHCHLFLDSKGRDKNELRRFIYANSIDRHVIRKLLQKIFVPCACAKILKDSDLAKELREEIEAVNGIDWDTDFAEESTAANEQPTKAIQGRPKRLCPGHEICFSIESTIQQLDIPQENIFTFLCYLELDGQRYIQALSSAYTTCKVMSYGGVRPLRMAAKECPPLAMAFALDLKRGISHDTTTVIEFPVIDVAAAIGWDSGVVKFQLKNLEWTTVNNVRKRSPLSVTFSDLGFRVRAPGDLTDEELDHALDALYERVIHQERTQLVQLQLISEALNSVCFNSIGPVSRADCPTGPSDKLKATVRQYFQTDISNENIEIIQEPDETTDEQLQANIRTMIARYPENNFTGRAIARLFHGVQSPNYPALIWSRSNFWRAFTSTDFNRIVRLANAEIVRMKT